MVTSENLRNCKELCRGGRLEPTVLQQHNEFQLELTEVSRMLCSVAVSDVMLPTMPDLHKKNQAWKEVATHTSDQPLPLCPQQKH